MASHTKQAIGIDVDPNNIWQAERLAPNCQFKLADACSLPIEDEFADCVVGLEMIYYLPDLELFFSEVARILSPAGKLLLTWPNPSRIAFQASPFSTHYPSIKEISELASRVGIETTFFGSRADAERRSFAEFARRILVWTRLVPQSLEGRARLKRVFFRDMQSLGDIQIDPNVAFEGLLPIDEITSIDEFAMTYCIGKKTTH